MKRTLRALNGAAQVSVPVAEPMKIEGILTLFHRLIENLPTAVLVETVDRRIVAVNASFCKVFTPGRRPRDLVGTDGRDGVYAMKDCFPQPNRFVRRVEEIVGGHEPVTGERLDLRDGRCVTRDYTPISTGTGLFAGHMWQYTDVTGEIERRQLEERLARSQRLEAVGQLAGGIAHDFNNVLTAIEGYTSAMIEVGLDSELVHDLEQIRSAGRRAADLVRDLLAFSRRQVLQPIRVNPQRVVCGAEALLRRVIREDIQLHVHCPDPVSDVLVDPAKLETVLLNLAINARDAMPEGGELTISVGELTWKAQDRTRFSFAIQPGTYVLISVSDTGHGIPEEIRERLFEPFFTTKPLGEGTGLGLSMVYGFVKQSGGFIWIESDVGCGATFHIALPALEGRELPAEQDPVRPDPGRLTGVVLVAEDDGAVLSVVRRALASRGLTVLEATDGLEALEALAAGGADLLVTDVVMPRMGGLDLARTIRRTGSQMPILFMTGHASGMMETMKTLGGPARLLAKPFSPAEVAAVVAEMLAE